MERWYDVALALATWEPLQPAGPNHHLIGLECFSGAERFAKDFLDLSKVILYIVERHLESLTKSDSQ